VDGLLNAFGDIRYKNLGGKRIMPAVKSAKGRFRMLLRIFSALNYQGFG